jgi:molybdate transport system ATP-binding protein
MSLVVAVHHRLGAFPLEASFEAGPGLTALFGRSGAGKTSLVNVIAGLIRPEHGRIVVDGDTLVDTDRRVFVPVHRRRVGYVFQEDRLFPHLSVRQNLLYGSRFASRATGGDLDQVAALLGLEALLDRRPARLSGGEKQRVAIGRALLADPRILLMDEPLASLDEPRKAEILPFIERLRDENRLPIVYVSHSIAEVARLATTMVVLADGRVSAVGPTAEVMRQLDLLPPAARGEAGTVMEATVQMHDEHYGLTLLVSRAGPFQVPRLDLPVGAVLRIRVRARDVIVATQRPVGLSAANVLAGTIADFGVPEGAAADVRIACGEEMLLARLTRRSIDLLGLRPGLPVHAVIKTVAFDRHSLGAPIRGAVESEEV